MRAIQLRELIFWSGPDDLTAAAPWASRCVVPGQMPGATVAWISKHGTMAPSGRAAFAHHESPAQGSA